MTERPRGVRPDRFSWEGDEVLHLKIYRPPPPETDEPPPTDPASTDETSTPAAPPRES